jgi:hypothetical protein
MTYLSSVSTTSRIVKLIMFNLLGCLFLWWLIIDDPRRKPVLVVLIPLMLLIDVVFIRRIFGNRNAAAISLPIIYLCGLAYGAWWATHNFAWWKMQLLIVPLLLLANSVQRLRKARSPKSDQ